MLLGERLCRMSDLGERVKRCGEERKEGNSEGKMKLRRTGMMRPC